jgi:porphobilinogen synthase
MRMAPVPSGTATRAGDIGMVTEGLLRANSGRVWDGEDSVRVADGVLSRNVMGNPWVEQRARPRRNRKSEAVRKMVREVIVTPANFIYPLFIHDETSNVAIASMPGCERHSLASMVAEAKDAYKWGVRSFVVFPKVPDALKTIRGEEAYNPNGIVPRAVSMLKQALPDSIVCTDVALDPYSAAGHDGIVENGKILYPVKGATIIGNGPDALTRVKMIGIDLALDSGVGVCGKEGQSVPVGVGQPTLRIDGLTVGGTA